MTTLQRLSKEINERAKRESAFNMPLIKQALNDVCSKYRLTPEAIQEILSTETPGKLYLECTKDKIIKQIITVYGG